MSVKYFITCSFILTQIWFSTKISNHVSKKISNTDTMLSMKTLLCQFQYRYEILNKKKSIKAIQLNSKQLKLKIGDTAEWIITLKSNLFLLGDLKFNNQNELFDSSLQIAIASFQERHGIKKTGYLNNSFIQEMNTPMEYRIRQMKANMERYKEYNLDTSRSLILINIPEFRLHVYENGKDKWNMAIIVGKKSTPTIEFNHYIQYIVFCPYWNVPESILKNELERLIKKDKYYLTKHHMERVGNSIRQKPGYDNPLGNIKFLFPNKYNIYMHDTPLKALFNSDNRAFSHGCIRLSEAKKLAMYILHKENDWKGTEMEDVMKCESEKYYKIKSTIPIKIIYSTCWVDKNGDIQFRKDIYNKFGLMN